MPKKLGFSLIELMVTLAVLGIVLAIAAPDLSIWVQRTRLKGVTENFSQDLALAKSESSRLNKPVRLNLQAGSAVCYGLSVRDCDCRISNSAQTNYCEIKRVGDLGQITLTPNSGHFDGLIFNAVRGLPLSKTMGTLPQAQILRISNSAGETQVVLNLIGRICIQSPAGTKKISGYPDAC